MCIRDRCEDWVVKDLEVIMRSLDFILHKFILYIRIMSLLGLYFRQMIQRAIGRKDWPVERLAQVSQWPMVEV